MQGICEMKLWSFAKMPELAKKPQNIWCDIIRKVLGMLKFPFYYFKPAAFQSKTISLALKQTNKKKEYWPVTSSA